MVRRKGQRSKWLAERDFPYGVEIEVPPLGFGEQLNALHGWCSERSGVDGYVVTGRRDGMRDYVVFRFKDQAMAGDFRKWIDGKVKPSPFSRRTFM